MKAYVYKNDEDMMQAQLQFIELGLHTLRQVEYVSDLLRESYYNIITLILQRGELDLNSMAVGFNEKFKGGKRDKVLKGEIAIV